MIEAMAPNAGPEIQMCAPDGLIRLESWGDAATLQARLADHLGVALPPPCRAIAAGELRLVWWEPKVWLIRTTRSDAGRILDALEAELGEDGALTDVSGGFARVRIAGPGWRDLLMIGGVFDAESPTFAPGCVAGTVIHHLPVRLDVIDAVTVDAYTPPSYAPDLLSHWSRSAQRLRQ